MIHAVLDANVIVSGVLGVDRAESTPGEIWRCWRRGEFAMVVSATLINEVERALRNRHFAPRIDRKSAAQVVTWLKVEAIQIAVADVISGVASHPEDDLVLATAVSGAADYLVTGDRQLLRLGAYEKVTIIGPRDFLAVIEGLPITAD